MSDQDTLTGYINKFVDLTAQENAEIVSCFKKILVKKRQFIIQPGFPAKHRYFVLKGAIRAYVIGQEGQDHTVQLAIDDWWISDYTSYVTQQPASMFVMAVEDSELFEISFEDEQRLKATNHKLETFFRMMAEKGGAFMQKRIISNLTLSAEKRYDLFLKKYPLMVNRFPQYVIASYLGMTTEFLSKIRNQKVTRKS